ncbi:putative transposase [Luteimonas cucumeris]|uniref:Putative transposase n=1 Tax=Luteimonas cucumeris TaxID=985012 RepID=A0A562LE93_9GAMM|nr:transposase [Luteimonas cucumeris]TWI05957.1 putative transposase [Luteimonas cucumeris]
MTNYRRASVPGATYFFTVNLANRDTTLLTDRIDDLRNAMRCVRVRHPFAIDAMVVLPEHIHALWTLPDDDFDYALRWRLIKTWFARHAPQGERRRASRIAKGERGIWQRRYWEHLVRHDDDLRRHVDYIPHNPVKHGHVVLAVDWPYSTFHRYVAEGRLPLDWGGDAGVGEKFGERG